MGASVVEGEALFWSPLETAWNLVRVFLAFFAFYSALTFDNTVPPSTKDFQLAVESRISGEKASIDVREAYFTNALNLLGCTLSSTYGLWVNLLFQIVRQGLHLIGFAGFERAMVRRRGKETQCLELARSYYLLSHVYTSANTVPLKAWVALLRALNVAESVGSDNNPLLAEIYSQMSFHLRFHLPQHSFLLLKYLARYYRRQSQETRARSVCSTKTHGYLALHDAWEKMASGELGEAASDLLIVKNYFVRSNRVRSAWEVLMFRGIALYLQGNVTECAKVCQEIDEVGLAIQSDERSDADSASSITSLVFWNKILLAVSLVHKEPVSEVVALLEEIAKLEVPHDESKWTENQFLQKTLLKAITAYALSRQEKDEEALKYAEAAFSSLICIPQKTMFMGVAQLSASLISATVIESWRHLAGKDNELENKAATLNRMMTVLLQKFARSIPFAAPRAFLCEAITLCLKGDMKTGLQRLHKAEVRAVKQKMPMERALAIYYKCVFLKEFSLQDALLSESIFMSIGADYEADRVKALISSEPSSA